MGHVGTGGFPGLNAGWKGRGETRWDWCFLHSCLLFQPGVQMFSVQRVLMFSAVEVTPEVLHNHIWGHSPSQFSNRYSRNSFFTSINKQNYPLHLPVIHQSRSSRAVTVICDWLEGSALLGAIQSPVQSRAEEPWQTMRLERLPSRFGQCCLSVVLVPQEIAVTAHLQAALTAPLLPFAFPTHGVLHDSVILEVGLWSESLISPAYVWEIMVLLKKELHYLLPCWRLVLCWFRLTFWGEILMQVSFRN